jgi:D-psicose/D-tagatose/L-ribulose 3-epimerase
MNIEESDVGKAFLTVKDCVEVVHFADSNRRALGQGHIDFRPVVTGMKAIGFDKRSSSNAQRQGPIRSEPTRATQPRKLWQSMQRNRLLS